MGSCFLVNGIKYREARFNSFATNCITSLNLIALCCLLIPSTLFRLSDDEIMLVLSHAIAISLLILYILYLFFTLRSHRDYFYEDSESIEQDAVTGVANLSLQPVAATAWLAISLTCITFCTVALVSSIQLSTWKANYLFLGFILCPFLGNVTDYRSACSVALKNDMDVAIYVTIGSSTQLLFFTLPILVILGWIINEPMTLQLDVFESAAVFLGVFVVNGLVSGAKSNYLTGAICIAL